MHPSKSQPVIIVGFIAITVLIILFALIVNYRYAEYSSNPNVDAQSNFDGVLWSADFETKNLDQYKIGTKLQSEFDSGACSRPGKGVSTDYAHSGRYSMKMKIDSSVPHSGCRQFRNEEIRTGNSYYYSTWMYIPKNYKINGWSNIMQFKSKTLSGADNDSGSEVFWVARISNRDNGKGNMYLQLVWDGENGEIGPRASDSGQTIKYDQDVKDLPVGKWVHLEAYLKQSEQYDGRITIWQDGVELIDQDGVKTKFPNGVNSWSINSYGGSIKPVDFTLYYDDVAISTKRLSE